MNLGMNMMLETLVSSLGIDMNMVNQVVQSLPQIITHCTTKINHVDETQTKIFQSLDSLVKVMRETNYKLDYLIQLQTAHNIESGTGLMPIMEQEGLLENGNTYCGSANLNTN